MWRGPRGRTHSPPGFRVRVGSSPQSHGDAPWNDPLRRRPGRSVEIAAWAGRRGRTLLPDPHKGALTQIFLEVKPDATPEIVEKVVDEVDTLVRQVRFTGWQASTPGDAEVRRQLRLVLKNHGLDPVGPLFDRAYAYIAENY